MSEKVADDEGVEAFGPDDEARQDCEAPSHDDLIERAAEVIKLGTEEGRTVGTAESCTGGLVAGALTAIPGSSVVVRGGVVSYAIPVKHEVLGVDSEILDDPARGAVSQDCAREMAAGARKVLKSDVAVSVTGIAGPGGEEPGKPVGTVWFGLSSNGVTREELHCFTGDRSEVRLKAVWTALGLLHEGLVE